MSVPFLCQVCASLPFEPTAPPFGPSAQSNPFVPIWLGALGDVRNSDCAFCKLIAFSSLEVERKRSQYLAPDQRVGLWWANLKSPQGFRLLFSGAGSSNSTFICFVYEPRSWPRGEPHPSNFFLPIYSSLIDLPRVRGWVNFCESQHGTLCGPQTGSTERIDSVFPGLKVLRLIDIENYCLVEVSRLCRYVTISYVWGAVPSARLTRANLDRLTQPGAITEAWNLVPRTIKDAIMLVSGLGERYLWVDSLCLVQNEPDDLKAGVAVMDLIYEHSVLTVIAAFGHDANAGLPGVQSMRTSNQCIRTLRPGLAMAVYTEVSGRLLGTTYDSRAWT